MFLASDQQCFRDTPASVAFSVWAGVMMLESWSIASLQLLNAKRAQIMP